MSRVRAAPKLSARDLFGAPTVKKRAKPVLHEAAALTEVTLALKLHPSVAWFERMNSGATVVGGRFIRFGFPGCTDLLGQLKDGRLLAVEVKAPKGRCSPEQVTFMATVRLYGGVSFVARNLLDVRRGLTPSAL